MIVFIIHSIMSAILNVCGVTHDNFKPSTYETVCYIARVCPVEHAYPDMLSDDDDDERLPGK